MRRRGRPRVRGCKAMMNNWVQTGAHLEQMRERGSSVILNWGEDTNCWECSWITSGKRYTGVSTNPHEAVRLALLKFVEAP